MLPPSGLCYFGTGLYLPGGSWGWKSSGQQQDLKRLVVGLKNRTDRRLRDILAPIPSEQMVAWIPPPFAQPPAEKPIDNDRQDQPHRRSVFVNEPSSGQSSDGMHATATSERPFPCSSTRT